MKARLVIIWKGNLQFMSFNVSGVLLEKIVDILRLSRRMELYFQGVPNSSFQHDML